MFRIVFFLETVGFIRVVSAPTDFSTLNIQSALECGGQCQQSMWLELELQRRRNLEARASSSAYFRSHLSSDQSFLSRRKHMRNIPLGADNNTAEVTALDIRISASVTALPVLMFDPPKSDSSFVGNTFIETGSDACHGGSTTIVTETQFGARTTVLSSSTDLYAEEQHLGNSLPTRPCSAVPLVASFDQTGLGWSSIAAHEFSTCEISCFTRNTPLIESRCLYVLHDTSHFSLIIIFHSHFVDPLEKSRALLITFYI